MMLVDDAEFPPARLERPSTHKNQVENGAGTVSILAGCRHKEQ
jgi:hypothetical protein